MVSYGCVGAAMVVYASAADLIQRRVRLLVLQRVGWIERGSQVQAQEEI